MECSGKNQPENDKYDPQQSMKSLYLLQSIGMHPLLVLNLFYRPLRAFLGFQKDFQWFILYESRLII